MIPRVPRRTEGNLKRHVPFGGEATAPVNTIDV